MKLWTAEDCGAFWRIRRPDNSIFSSGITREEAEEVVRAVNGHDKFVRELIRMMAEFEGAAKRAGWSQADIDHQTYETRALLKEQG